MPDPDQSTLEHFRTFGWICIRGAFSADEAAGMCPVDWSALAKVGIHRNDPGRPGIPDAEELGRVLSALSNRTRQ